MRLPTVLLIAALHSIAATASESVPKAVIADPPTDAKFPARMEVIHVPSGSVQINGVVYVASGEQPHPAFVFFHGLPGNEKNLDLAQAVRRAGWTVVTVNIEALGAVPEIFDSRKTWKMRRQRSPSSGHLKTQSVFRLTRLA